VLTSSPFPATAERTGLLLRRSPAKLIEVQQHQRYATTCHTEFAT
jgi:hypothetical protein